MDSSTSNQNQNQNEKCEISKTDLDSIGFSLNVSSDGRKTIYPLKKDAEGKRLPPITITTPPLRVIYDTLRYRKSNGSFYPVKLLLDNGSHVKVFIDKFEEKCLDFLEENSKDVFKSNVARDVIKKFYFKTTDEALRVRVKDTTIVRRMLSQTEFDERVSNVLKANIQAGDRIQINARLSSLYVINSSKTSPQWDVSEILHYPRTIININTFEDSSETKHLKLKLSNNSSGKVKGAVILYKGRELEFSMDKKTTGFPKTPYQRSWPIEGVNVEVGKESSENAAFKKLDRWLFDEAVKSGLIENDYKFFRSLLEKENSRFSPTIVVKFPKKNKNESIYNDEKTVEPSTGIVLVNTDDKIVNPSMPASDVERGMLIECVSVKTFVWLNADKRQFGITFNSREVRLQKQEKMKIHSLREADLSNFAIGKMEFDANSGRPFGKVQFNTFNTFRFYVRGFMRYVNKAMNAKDSDPLENITLSIEDSETISALKKIDAVCLEWGIANEVIPGLTRDDRDAAAAFHNVLLREDPEKTDRDPLLKLKLGSMKSSRITVNGKRSNSTTVDDLVCYKMREVTAEVSLSRAYIVTAANCFGLSAYVNAIDIHDDEANTEKSAFAFIKKRKLEDDNTKFEEDTKKMRFK